MVSSMLMRDDEFRTTEKVRFPGGTSQSGSGGRSSMPQAEWFKVNRDPYIIYVPRELVRSPFLFAIKFCEVKLADRITVECGFRPINRMTKAVDSRGLVIMRYGKCHSNSGCRPIAHAVVDLLPERVRPPGKPGWLQSRHVPISFIASPSSRLTGAVLWPIQ